MGVAPSLLDEIEAQTRRLSRAQQLELARRLLSGPVAPEEESEQYEITDWIGLGKGTWKTAEEVDRYIQEERDSWDR